jgi:hypothetical protein
MACVRRRFKTLSTSSASRSADPSIRRWTLNAEIEPLCQPVLFPGIRGSSGVPCSDVGSPAAKPIARPNAIVLSYWDATLAEADVAALLSIVSRISRTRFRRRIFRFRNRPNLALSPFLADIIPSFANSPL